MALAKKSCSASSDPLSGLLIEHLLCAHSVPSRIHTWSAMECTWELHTQRNVIGSELQSLSPGCGGPEEGVINSAKTRERILTLSSSALDSLLISGERSVLFKCDNRNGERT